MALTAPIALALAAFAVDEGSIFTERRGAQSLVDIAAITAAANLGDPETAVLTTLRDNGIRDVEIEQPTNSSAIRAGRVSISIERGHYTPSATAAAAIRFRAEVKPFNAVRVTLRKSATRFFAASLLPAPTIRTQGTAAVLPQAMFSVGSRLASVNNGLLNAVLGKLVGGNVSLSAMDYNALVGADVDLLSYLDALAVKLKATGPTYSDVLASKATVGQLASVMADVPGMDSTAKLALKSLASAATSSVKIPLNQVVDLGPIGAASLGQRPAGLSLGAGALSLISAAGVLAGGSNQVQVNLGATVPGLTYTTLDVAIGERQQTSPWITVGEAGATVRTAQVRLKLSATAGVGNGNLGGGIKLLSVRLPLHAEVAGAEATLSDISCPSGRPESLRVSIATKPGLASLRLAESPAAGFGDFSKPLSFGETKIAEVSVKLLLISLDLLSVNGQAHVAVGNTNSTTLTFDKTDIAGRKVKTAATRNVAQSLTTSLVNNLSLSVNALGLGLDATALLGTVKPAVVAVLDGVAAPVDDLLYNVLGMLGVRIGEADVRVHGATCGRAVLVQ